MNSTKNVQRMEELGVEKETKLMQEKTPIRRLFERKKQTGSYRRKVG